MLVPLTIVVLSKHERHHDDTKVLVPEYDTGISYNDTPRSNYSSVTKSYNTTVAVRWQAVYQGLIKLISKFVTLFIITIYLCAMHGVFYKLQTCECHIWLAIAAKNHQHLINQ